MSSPPRKKKSLMQRFMSKFKKNESNNSQSNGDKKRNKTKKVIKPKNKYPSKSSKELQWLRKCEARLPDNDPIDTKEPEQPKPTLDSIMTDPGLADAFIKFMKNCASNASNDDILTQIICDVVRYEVLCTNDLTMFFRQINPTAHVLNAYLSRGPISRFADPIVKEACQPMLDDYKENLEIRRPYVSCIECDDVTKTIKERKEKLMELVDSILSKILNADSYPRCLLIICQTLNDLAASKGKQNHMQLRYSFICGAIFLPIFSAKIACRGALFCRIPPYKQCGNMVRTNFTLVTKVLQSIGNQLEPGKKEEFMKEMDSYISSKFEQVHKFLNELCDITLPDRELVLSPLDLFYDSHEYKTWRRSNQITQRKQRQWQQFGQ